LSQINVLPLEEEAIFQSLTGIHSEVIDAADFRLVHNAMNRIRQHIPKLLFLFLCERLSADNIILFLMGVTKNDFCLKRIGAEIIIRKAAEYFPQPLHFPIVRINSNPGRFEVIGEILDQQGVQLVQSLYRLRFSASELSFSGRKSNEFIQSRMVKYLFFNLRCSFVRALIIQIPDFAERDLTGLLGETFDCVDLSEGNFFVWRFPDGIQLSSFPAGFLKVTGFQGKFLTDTIRYLEAIVIWTIFRFLPKRTAKLTHFLPALLPDTS